MPSIAATHAHTSRLCAESSADRLPTAAIDKASRQFSAELCESVFSTFLPSLDAPGAMEHSQWLRRDAGEDDWRCCESNPSRRQRRQTKAMMTAHLQQMKLISAEGQWAKSQSSRPWHLCFFPRMSAPGHGEACRCDGRECRRGPVS